jgi:hypothetical protein
MAGRVFIQIDSENRIVLEHYAYDSLTAQQKLSFGTGYFVDSIPEPELIPGKSAVKYYNPNTGLITIQYVDAELTPEQQEIEDLKNRVTLMQSALDDLILGGAL